LTEGKERGIEMGSRGLLRKREKSSRRGGKVPGHYDRDVLSANLAVHAAGGGTQVRHQENCHKGKKRTPEGKAGLQEKA